MAVRGQRQRRRESIELADTELVTRARSGDGAAYGQLVGRHQEVAVRVAQRFAGGVEDAEDAVQDAFLKAYTHLPQFRAGAPFRPWLLQIVANEAKNRRTAAARRSVVERRAAAAAEAATGEGRDRGVITGREATPEEVVLAAERRRIVGDALRALRAEDHAAIAYRYVYDLSEAEMASALGVARGTVKSRLSRAMTRLRAVVLPLLMAVLLLVLTGGALALLPGVRSAVAQRLGLRDVSLTHVSSLPPAVRGVPTEPDTLTVPPPPEADAPATTEAPDVAPVGRGLGLGEPVDLEAARARVGFAPLLPALPRLGPPDEVYADANDDAAGARLTLLYRPTQSLPAVGSTGVGLLVTELRSAADRNVPLAKQLGPNTRLQEVQVNGGRGYWIEGQAHVVLLRDRNGVVREDTIRLAGNTLLWEQGELTLRVELAGTKEEALRIATSMAGS
jgi:RNA polymerase sigma factor (sigma-70 family)